jgi:hypothetical protein
VGKGPVNSVSFDYSGIYLGIGGGGNAGNQLNVKVVKDWSNLVVSSDFLLIVSVSYPSFFLQSIPHAHDREITSIAWSTHAQSLISGSLDETVRIFANQ